MEWIHSLEQPTIGQDSELAFVDEKGAYPSTLIYPEVVKGVVRGRGSDQFWEIGTDGRQAEIRTAPTYCREYQNDMIFHAIESASNTAKIKGLTLSCKSAVPMLLSRVRQGGEKCIESGCNPDFDAEGRANVTRCVFSKARFCFSGVHQHVTIRKPSMAWKDWASLIHLLDLFVGIPMEAICFDKSSKHRRKFYGRAGCHRPTSYGESYKGVEYRVLGGWVLQSPALMSLAFSLQRVAVGLMANEFYKDAINLIPRADVEGIINNCDREAAVNAMNAVILPYLDSLISVNGQERIGTKKVNRLFYAEWALNKQDVSFSAVPREIYEMAMSGVDFFSCKSVEENWGVGRSYCGHGGTAKGWKNRAMEIKLDLNAKKGTSK